MAQFERLGTRGEHEVAMAVVHDDHVVFACYSLEWPDDHISAQLERSI